jgi:hypothetical protein
MTSKSEMKGLAVQNPLLMAERACQLQVQAVHASPADGGLERTD